MLTWRTSVHRSCTYTPANHSYILWASDSHLKSVMPTLKSLVAQRTQSPHGVSHFSGSLSPIFSWREATDLGNARHFIGIDGNSPPSQLIEGSLTSKSSSGYWICSSLRNRWQRRYHRSCLREHWSMAARARLLRMSPAQPAHSYICQEKTDG